MAEVYPFIGTRYNSQLIGDLSKVVCPPCDMISDDLQASLYAKHENNAVRLEKTRTDDDSEDDNFSNRFTRAANTLGTWRSDGVIIEDDKPSFYLIEQSFQDSTGTTHSRIGFVGKVKLGEKTAVDAESAQATTGQVANSLELLRNTNANVGGVSALFPDGDENVSQLLRDPMKERPWEELTDENGVTHRLWVVQKKQLLLGLMEELKNREIFVVEGHHRYLAAQLYRDERRAEAGKADGKQPYDFVMMSLFPAEQPSLHISSLHRGLTKTIMADVNLKEALAELEDYFDLKKDKVDLTAPAKEADRLLKALKDLRSTAPAMTLIHASGAVYHLALQPDTSPEALYDDPSLPESVSGLDACILHNFIINQVFIGNPEYELEDDECITTTSAARLLELLRDKKITCGFLLLPPEVPHILKLSETGTILPLETGVIAPRTCTGLVLRNLQADVRKTGKK